MLIHRWINVNRSILPLNRQITPLVQLLSSFQEGSLKQELLRRELEMLLHPKELLFLSDRKEIGQTKMNEAVRSRS